MLFLDVNVCLFALRPDISEEAEGVRGWVQEALVGHEQVGLSELVLSAMVRLATNGRIFSEPTSPRDAVAFADAMLGAPAASAVRPGARHWTIFGDLTREHRLRANDVPDAYLAALAMEAGATFVTLDRGFARFEKLKRLHPLN